MTELLSDWQMIRSDPAWLIETSNYSPADWKGLIDDCKDQAERLSELETLLEELGSPACQLPLQGVRCDKSRLAHALDRFERRIV